jgi:hypothetical protein
MFMRWRGWARWAAGGVALAMVLSACGRAPEPPLAEATAACRGYVARLTIEPRATPTDEHSPYRLRGAHWRAEVRGLPTPSALRELGAPLRVHVETFTIRGQQAVREDIFDGQWRSLGPYLLLEGPIQLSDALGALQAGDRGGMFLTVMPPDGTVFWTSHLQFQLRAPATAPEIEAAWVAPVAELQCP